MSKLIKLEEDKKGDFKQLPEGTHVGILYQVIDLGLQTVSFAGETLSPAFKLWLSFEFPNQLTDDGRPLIQGLEVKLSFHSKSKLVEIVKALTGGTNASLLEGIKTNELLGKAASIGVGRTKTGNAKLTGFQAMPDGMSVPEAINELMEFDLDSPNTKVFEAIPKFLQDKINSRLETTSSAASKQTENKDKSTDF